MLDDATNGICQAPVSQLFIQFYNKTRCLGTTHKIQHMKYKSFPWTMKQLGNYNHLNNDLLHANGHHPPNFKQISKIFKEWQQ